MDGPHLEAINTNLERIATSLEKLVAIQLMAHATPVSQWESRATMLRFKVSSLASRIFGPNLAAKSQKTEPELKKVLDDIGGKSEGSPAT